MLECAALVIWRSQSLRTSYRAQTSRHQLADIMHTSLNFATEQPSPPTPWRGPKSCRAASSVELKVTIKSCWNVGDRSGEGCALRRSMLVRRLRGSRRSRQSKCDDTRRLAPSEPRQHCTWSTSAHRPQELHIRLADLRLTAGNIEVRLGSELGRAQNSATISSSERGCSEVRSRNGCAKKKKKRQRYDDPHWTPVLLALNEKHPDHRRYSGGFSDWGRMARRDRMANCSGIWP